MFLDNKYLRWYQTLCSKQYDGPGRHRHHIIPRALGGTDDAENIVDLSYRQHFIAHRLLLKITTGKNRSKMAFAMMRFGSSSRSYAAVSRQISEALSGAGNPMFGRKLSDKHRASISGEKHGMHGRGCYDVWVERYGVEVADQKHEIMVGKRSASMTGERNHRYGTTRTMEQKMAQSARMTGSRHPLFGKKRHPSKWMNDSRVCKMVKVEFVKQHLDRGWAFGRLPKQLPKQMKVTHQNPLN